MSAHIIILGFVQGVGMRRFIAKKANQLGLSGWVKNLPDSRVEVLVQGDKEKIVELIKIIEQGNIFSDVKDVVVEWAEDKETLNDFLIL
ncbi:MAG: hypothetical protein A2798_00085 [Candidatus Levybacteria bacterium RIFCSPHIGHO2_01_FULL_37_17]|nr:MAG: hypothetical protein A2798_00085 [Candidatus Levybacteria bacterium RIFCSPHIGHO2_01_FULL_37_17]OGH36506.1 MAG: hypothetical protein A2959_03280 [Candidatus Levybacteria bacterium RIFCSPLOWO2_01_FULL_38_23]